MKNLLRILVTLMVSTSMAYAQTTTTVDEVEQVMTVLEEAHQLNEDQVLRAQDCGLDKINKRLDREIQKAERSNETIEATIARLDKKMTADFNRQYYQVSDILNSSKKTEKYFKRVKKVNPEITLEQFKSKILDQISVSKFSKNKQHLLKEVVAAGSYSAYLKDYKNKLNDAKYVVKTESSNSRKIASFDEMDMFVLAILGYGVAMVGIVWLFASAGWAVGLGVLFLIAGIAGLIEHYNGVAYSKDDSNSNLIATQTQEDLIVA